MPPAEPSPLPPRPSGLSPLRLAQLLLLLNMLIWIGLGILGLVYLPGDPLSANVAVVIVGLMFVNALLMAWVAWGLGRGSRPLYWLGLGLVGVNLVLSVIDQFGFFDLLVLALDATLLGLLFVLRKRFGITW